MCFIWWLDSCDLPILSDSQTETTVGDGVIADFQGYCSCFLFPCDDNVVEDRDDSRKVVKDENAVYLIFAECTK